MKRSKEMKMQTSRAERSFPRGPRRGHRRRVASRGLTLVELIVVITIIGVLTAAISVGVMSAKKSADLKLAKTACNTIRDATIQWKAVHSGEDCPTIDQLKQEKILDTGFSVKDPWGVTFKMACDSDEITCSSAGPDRKEGTEDDLHVPQADIPGSK
ncbi:MAG: type II secretion system GspH family protein [Myxococcota bacterium]|nr:type II secretion system GspH family protein [Myxococcota bacterium]